MRSFLIAAAVTVIAGLGSFAAFAAGTGSAEPPVAALAGLQLPAPKSLTLAPAGDVQAVESGSFVARDLAFERLTLEAQLQELFARLEAEAAGKTEAERVALYHEAEAELTRLVLGSTSYSGSNAAQGHDYLAVARLALAQRLGLDSIPA